MSNNTYTNNGLEGIDVYRDHVNPVPIAQSSRLAKDGAPYIFSAGFRVAGSASPVLTIDPGVTVKISGWPIDVGGGSPGGLDAQGTVNEPIIFTSNRATPQPRDWRGIRFVGSITMGILKNATVEYADTGVYIEDVSPLIQNNIIQHNNRGIDIENTVKTSFKKNIIINNLNYGIYINGYLTNYFVGEINENDLYNNGTYDLYADGGQSSITINADNNWWGTTNPAIIAAHIYDRNDNSNRPLVDFTPFLYGPGEIPLVNNMVVTPLFFDPYLPQTTSINYSMARDGNVTVKIFDFNTGGLVRTLVNNQIRLTGPHSDIWDGKSDVGTLLPPGLYVFEMEATDTHNAIGGYSPHYTPTQVQLIQNSLNQPNFNPYKGETLGINFNIAEDAFVTLKSGPTNTLASSKTILNNEPTNVVTNSTFWNGRDDAGNIVPQTSLGYYISIWPNLLPENAIVIQHSPPTIGALSANPYVVRPYYGEATKIEYNLLQTARITLDIKKSNGTQVIRLVNDQLQSSGIYFLNWDGRDQFGNFVTEEDNYRIDIKAVDPNYPQIFSEREGNVSVLRQ
jgi:flagellar hook assembly protein FlgD